MIKRIGKWLVFKWVYPVCYKMASCNDINRKKIIFVENHQSELTDNFILYYQELKKRDYEVHVHYLKISSSGWKDIIRRSIALIKDMGNASCIFLNESNSLFGAFKLRRETKLVQVWHACGAFKKWGYSVADKSFGDDRKSLEQYSGHYNYTLVPVSGKEVCWAYEEAFGLEPDSGIVRPLGVSRTDIYFRKEFLDASHEKLKQMIPFLNNRKVILYIPTFRGEIRTAVSPKELDIARLFDCFHEDYMVLVKQHPFIRESYVVEEAYSDFCMEIRDEMTTDELLAVADICITDYSSVVFDFSLLEKPILFFAYDLERYYDERGFYYPYETFVPGPVVKNNCELIECISKIKEFDYNKIRDFKERYMSGCDGHATKRILEQVFDGEF